MKAPAIFVVEDEGIIARDIRQQLLELGYEVAGDATTGEDAIAQIGRLKPDLVLMDIHLAGAMDGIQAAQTIRREYGIPVVFLTAFAGAETLERAKLTEPFGYIIKPFDERYLHTVVEMALYKHRAETHLRRAYDEQATMLRTALDAFFMADWHGRLIDVNESSCAMLGYTRDELLQMSLSELDAAPAKAKIALLEGLKQPEAARFERAQRRKDGSTVLVEMSVNYLPHSGGRIFCFARDITERRAAEDALMRLNEELEVRVSLRTQDLEEARKQAEDANRAKARFLATMTHELRTPLSGVIGTLEVLKQTTLESHQMEMLDLVGESAASLLAIIDDILDFSKIEAGRLGIESFPFRPETVVEKAALVLAPMVEKLGAELLMFVDPKIPPLVLGDGVRLKQVLLNLANNALKFSSKQDRPSRVAMRALLAAKRGDEVTVDFEVTDNGIGMDEETIAGLFKSFSQGDASIARRFGGTGLGLAISHNLVELMGGRIVVTSKVSEGSNFRVSVPFTLPKDRSVATPVSASEVAGLSCVLVGQPSGLMRDLAVYLEAAGAAAEHVIDVEAAARHSELHPHGLQVWILEAAGDLPGTEVLRAAQADRTEGELRFLLIDRDRPWRMRPHPSDIFVIEASLLKRDAFLNAVAGAAGRVDVDTRTTPIAIRRSPVPVPSRAEAVKAGQLVLVAEDNEVSQKVIVHQLGLLGFAADVASGGHEALELWRTGDYSLLFADLHMPGMDGYQLTAAIRVQEGTEQHAVIIALTADVLQGGAQQCRDAGLDDYLCKPARLSEVKAMIEKWMPRRAAKGAASKTAPASTASEKPPVDVTVLEELVGRDPDVIHEFLRAFWISTAKTTSEIKDACLNREAALVADLAHKLKAPARSVGALRLAEICAEMQKAASVSDFSALNLALPALEAERARVEEYLRPA